MKRIAIMQPYFFPYLGYWQLINAVDKFVIYDDVNYITRGWVNRNKILVNGQAHYITVPVKNASQNRLITEIELHPESAWRLKLNKTISLNYKKSPFFSSVYPVLEKIIAFPSENLTGYLSHQLQTLATQMAIDTEFVHSDAYANNVLSGSARILDICKRENASTYINAPGGKSLYDPTIFASQGIELRFLKMRAIAYPQRGAIFLPNLSIVDVLMENGFERIRDYLLEFDLVP